MANSIPPVTDDYIDSVIKANDPFDPNRNKTQGIKVRELLKNLRDYTLQQSAISIISNTYAELANLVSTASLIPGQLYQITDYVTKYLDPSASVVKQGGVIEHIVIEAATDSTFLTDAFSADYPKDTLMYDFTANNIVVSPAIPGYYGLSVQQPFGAINGMPANPKQVQIWVVDATGNLQYSTDVSPVDPGAPPIRQLPLNAGPFKIAFVYIGDNTGPFDYAADGGIDFKVQVNGVAYTVAAADVQDGSVVFPSTITPFKALSFDGNLVINLYAIDDTTPVYTPLPDTTANTPAVQESRTGFITFRKDFDNKNEAPFDHRKVTYTINGSEVAIFANGCYNNRIEANAANFADNLSLIYMDSCTNCSVSTYNFQVSLKNCQYVSVGLSCVDLWLEAWQRTAFNGCSGHYITGGSDNVIHNLNNCTFNGVIMGSNFNTVSNTMLNQSISNCNFFNVTNVACTDTVDTCTLKGITGSTFTGLVNTVISTCEQITAGNTLRDSELTESYNCTLEQGGTHLIIKTCSVISLQSSPANFNLFNCSNITITSSIFKSEFDSCFNLTMVESQNNRFANVGGNFLGGCGGNDLYNCFFDTVGDGFRNNKMQNCSNLGAIGQSFNNNDCSGFNNGVTIGNSVASNKMYNITGGTFGNNFSNNYIINTSGTVVFGQNVRLNYIDGICDTTIGDNFMYNKYLGSVFDTGANNVIGTNAQYNLLINIKQFVVGDYAQYNLFRNCSGVTLGYEASNNNVEASQIQAGDFFQNNQLKFAGILSGGASINYSHLFNARNLHLGSYLSANSISNCSDITLGNNCHNNLFDNSNNCNLGEDSSQNRINGSFGLTAGSSFNQNIINNTSNLSLGNNFKYNNISYSSNLQLGDNCQYNSLIDTVGITYPAGISNNRHSPIKQVIKGIDAGVTIRFDSETVYGSVFQANTGNITYDNSGGDARFGTKIQIFHHDSAEATYPAGFKKLAGSSNYVANVLNIITAEYFDDNNILYTIKQLA